MIGRQKRLHEAYEHLRKFFGIHTQTDFAEVLKYSRVYISSALNGNEKNLTDKLFTNICEAFPGVFSLDYLLTGKGDLLTVEEDIKSTELNTSHQKPTQSSAAEIDTSSIMNAALAAQMESIELLKSEKATLLEAHARELQAKDDHIQSLRDQLADKDQIIAEQKARLIEYRRIIDSRDDMINYPFPIGTAEREHREQKNL